MPKFNTATEMVDHIAARITDLADSAGMARGNAVKIIAGQADCSEHYLRKMVARPDNANPSARVIDSLLEVLATTKTLKGAA